MSLGVEKLLPFDRLNIKNLSVQSYNLGADGWNFIKLLLDIWQWCDNSNEICQDVGHGDTYQSLSHLFQIYRSYCH